MWIFSAGIHFINDWAKPTYSTTAYRTTPDYCTYPELSIGMFDKNDRRRPFWETAPEAAAAAAFSGFPHEPSDLDISTVMLAAAFLAWATSAALGSPTTVNLQYSKRASKRERERKRGR